MSLFDRPQSTAILETFNAEIESLGGVVTDSIEHEGTLYARSTLEREMEVAPGDRMRAGIAMRAADQDIRVHPYVFRLVCKNGAIHSTAIRTEVISLEDPVTDPIIALREAIHLCAHPQAFARSMDQVRGAMEREADMILLFLPLLARVSRTQAPHLLSIITQHFNRTRDRSRYGLMNAVTATARDTKDPETRWRLEELGALVPALREQTPLERESKRALHVPDDSLVTA